MTTTQDQQDLLTVLAYLDTYRYRQGKGYCYSYQEAGRVVHCSKTTAYMRVQRWKERIRKELTDDN